MAILCEDTWRAAIRAKAEGFGMMWASYGLYIIDGDKDFHVKTVEDIDLIINAREAYKEKS